MTFASNDTKAKWTMCGQAAVSPRRRVSSHCHSTWGKWGTKSQPSVDISQSAVDSLGPRGLARAIQSSDGHTKRHPDTSCLALYLKTESTVFWIGAPTNICSFFCCWTLEWPLFFALVYKIRCVFYLLYCEGCFWRTCLLVHAAKTINKEAAS